MNDPRDPRTQPTAQPPQPAQPAGAEVSALARIGDPSLRRRSTDDRFNGSPAQRRGGLAWVRAFDVLTGKGQRLADWHALGQENLVRRMRHGMARIATSRRGVARQSAPSLPPVTAFGQQTVQMSSPAVTR